MFDRLLGPKTDHADPGIRAKAFAHESLTQSTINEALKSERDSDVLCVILGRADDLGAVLEHARGSDGSIANEARARIVALAEAGADGSADEWALVFESARSGKWSQLAALNDLLRPDVGREALVQGALQGLSDNHELSEPVLLTLATQSGGTAVRRLAARLLRSRDMLETCCHELREKDKTVYKELKERIDAFRLNDERRELAGKLEADCDTLAAASVAAQPEAVAVAQSRMQSLEQRIKELSQVAPEIGRPAAERWGKVSESVARTIQTARGQVERRKKTRSELEDIRARLSSDEMRADFDPVAELGRLHSAWQELPDHTDMEQSTFERELNSVTELAQVYARDREVTGHLSAKMDRWTSLVEGDAPGKLLQKVRREWDSAEKPRSKVQLAVLQERFDDLAKRLEQHESTLSEKRANNSRQLLAILDEFVATMEQGEFKKAMSLNDKLRARAANRELEPQARRRIEDELKKAQPRLEEFRKWRHFGTLQARENLIGQANTLISAPPASPKALASEVKGLREAWRKLDQDDGRASEAQWQTFNTACKEAYKPAKKHFDQLAKERKSNRALKEEVLASLKALLDDTDWSEPDWGVVTKQHKDLLVQWRKIGTVDYKVRKELDASFDKISAALDDQLREEREREVDRRRRLIERLSAQQQSESGGKLAGAAKRAQREWRPTVQSDRKTEQALWEEFRAVCDEIFGGLKQQQKEAKAAWQADAGEREAVCQQIDSLLADPDGAADRKAANQASGQLQELSRQWRQRHQIPGAVMSKLDKRFKSAKQAAEKRIRNVLKEEEKRASERLDQLHTHCQRAEEALLDGDFDLADCESRSDEFDGLRGAAGKALQKRYARALQGMKGDDSVKDSLQARLDDNLGIRQSLCLLGELVADIDSPAHAEKDRMALRMQRLTEAMQGELPPRHQELASIIDEWYSAGGVAAKEWAAINERFAKVRAAQGGSAH